MSLTSNYVGISQIELATVLSSACCSNPLCLVSRGPFKPFTAPEWMWDEAFWSRCRTNLVICEAILSKGDLREQTVPSPSHSQLCAIPISYRRSCIDDKNVFGRIRVFVITRAFIEIDDVSINNTTAIYDPVLAFIRWFVPKSTKGLVDGHRGERKGHKLV